LVFAIYVSLKKLVVQPIEVLGATITKRALGSRSDYANITSTDEMGMLAISLNHMFDAYDKAEQEIASSSQALKESELRYAGIVASAMDAIIVLDSQQTIQQSG
jgi:nitrate/nitrite-specific signal transduction histidine kinase